MYGRKTSGITIAAVRLLVVLHDGDHHPRQGQATGIERVHKLRLAAICRAIFDIRPSRLERSQCCWPS